MQAEFGSVPIDRKFGPEIDWFPSFVFNRIFSFLHYSEMGFFKYEMIF